MWVIGDNFVASTYRNQFKKMAGPWFIKELFEVRSFSGSKYASKIQNPLCRMVNSLVAAINDEVYLPEFILAVLDADLIDFLAFNGYGISTILGTWLEWLFTQFKSAINERKQQLPPKALKDDSPQVYWIAAPMHNHWSDEEFQMRIKFNNCLDSVAAVYGNWMRVIKLKEPWALDDSRLVVNNKFTTLGLQIYWKSIDAAFKFNYEKKIEFEARENYRKLLKKRGHKSQEELASGDTHVNEDMQQFFRRHRRPNWSGVVRGSRFMLPRPK